MPTPSPSVAPVHVPAPEAMQASRLAAFTRQASAAADADLSDPQALHAWSIRDWRGFWGLFLQDVADPLGITGDPEPVCVGSRCEDATFFPGLRLNYADSLLSPAIAPADAWALTACHAGGRRTRWTRGQLRARVARLADALAGLGIGEGDRVVAIMRNDDSAVVVALAVAAIGASLSTASPDMGVDAIADRFAPLAPRLLFAHAQPQAFDPGVALPARLAAVGARLSSLETLVRLDGDAPDLPLRQFTLAQLSARGDSQAFEWPRFGFNHPLFVMFSSGTTGRPKAIVHGAGGTLLEHVKEHRLHTDLRAGERMYFHTSCSWMMWNWQLSALASGVEIVTWDGPVASAETLWELVAREGVSVFGTSPAYLRLCEDAALAPAGRFDLRALRAVLSTGAPLQEAQYHWLRRAVGDLPLQSISGGTDIIGCFVLGHPHLPVHAGEAQSISLGLDVQAWQGGARADGPGELVCVNPFPSRPLGFFGDSDGARFHAAYFEQHPGVWTHGDLVEFTPRGGARLHGRTDGLLNVRGIKVAPAEIYRVLRDVPQLRDAMVVERRAEGGPQLVALLVLAPGGALDADLAARLRREVAARLSPAHVPDLLLDVAELPATHNGKPSEAAARSAVNGLPAQNAGSLRNPACLDAIREHPLLRAQAAPVPAQGSLEQQLQALWAQHLGLGRIGLDDHFFELGGNSLLAAAIVSQVRRLTGRALPLAALMEAPTVRRFAELLAAPAQDAAPASPVLVRMRAGAGRPLVLVHGLSGTAMECWPLVDALVTTRPVLALQARGIDGEGSPLDRVEALARDYVRALREAQPEGPYALCGFSFGGLVALEMARQLAQAGQAIELLCLLDPQLDLELPALHRTWYRGLRVLGKLARQPSGLRLAWLRAKWLQHQRRREGAGDGSPSALVPPERWQAMTDAQRAVYAALMVALAAYRPLPYDASAVLYLRARVPLDGYFDPMPVWRRVARAGLQVVDMPGSHHELVGRHARPAAAAIDAALGTAGLPGRDPGAGEQAPSSQARPLAAG